MIHPTAVVAEDCTVCENVSIWHFAQVREGAVIGRDTIIGGGAYIDVDVLIGPSCKVENRAMLFKGAILESGVFVGPGAIICNDKRPRAINEDGSRKGQADWTCGEVRVGRGASIGAGAIILPGVCIGEWAMIGAGAVVTKNVGAFELWYGNPARCMGMVSEEGERSGA